MYWQITIQHFHMIPEQEFDIDALLRDLRLLHDRVPETWEDTVSGYVLNSTTCVPSTGALWSILPSSRLKVQGRSERERWCTDSPVFKVVYDGAEYEHVFFVRWCVQYNILSYYYDFLLLYQGSMGWYSGRKSYIQYHWKFRIKHVNSLTGLSQFHGWSPTSMLL